MWPLLMCPFIPALPVGAFASAVSHPKFALPIRR